jgi:hypothetical protein
MKPATPYAPWLAVITVITWVMLALATFTNVVQTARLNRLEEGLKAVAGDMVKLDVALQMVNSRITKLRGEMKGLPMGTLLPPDGSGKYDLGNTTIHWRGTMTGEKK